MTADEFETFNERAGICEYDGLLSRDDAEALAEVELESHQRALENAKGSE